MPFDPAVLQTSATLANGNYTFIATGSSTSLHDNLTRAVISIPQGSGKYYAEFTITVASQLGISDQGIGLIGSGIGAVGYLGGNGATPNGGIGFFVVGTCIGKAGTNLGTVTSFATGSVVALAVDTTANKVWFTNWSNAPAGWRGPGNTTGDPVAGSNGFDCSFIGASYFLAVENVAKKDQIDANLGQQQFIGTVPQGYIPWDTGCCLIGPLERKLLA